MTEPRKRQRKMPGNTYKVTTGCGNAYITITHDEQGLAEVFMTLGKSGGCAAAQSEAVCRLISMALRSGVQPAEIVDQLRGIRCPTPMMFPKEEWTLSCADGIARVLAEEAGLKWEVNDNGKETGSSQ